MVYIYIYHSGGNCLGISIFVNFSTRCEVRIPYTYNFHICGNKIMSQNFETALNFTRCEVRTLACTTFIKSWNKQLLKWRWTLARMKLKHHRRAPIIISFKKIAVGGMNDACPPHPSVGHMHLSDLATQLTIFLLVFILWPVPAPGTMTMYHMYVFLHVNVSWCSHNNHAQLVTMHKNTVTHFTKRVDFSHWAGWGIFLLDPWDW